VRLALGLVLSANQAAARAIPLANYIEIAATLIGPWLLATFSWFCRMRGHKSGVTANLYFDISSGINNDDSFPNNRFSVPDKPVLLVSILKIIRIGAGFLVSGRCGDLQLHQGTFY